MLKSGRALIYICLFFSILLLFFSVVVIPGKNVYGVVDAASCSLLVFLLFVVLMGFPSIVFTIIASVCFFAVIAFIQVSQEYFEFFGSYIGYDTLALFDEFLTALPKFAAGFSLLYIFVTLVGVYLFHTLLVARAVPPSRSQAVVLISLVVGGLFFTVGVHSERYNDSLLINPMAKLNMDYSSENPVMFFLRSLPVVQVVLRTDEELNEVARVNVLVSSLKKSALEELPDDYSVKNYDQFLPDNYSPRNKSKYQIESGLPDFSGAEPGRRKKNIIIIVMESFRSFEVGGLGSIAPQFNKIAAQSVAFSNAYSTARQTVRSEQAILCSTVDVTLGVPYSVSGGRHNGACLPSIVRARGYKTLWFHGNDREFFNRKAFHPSMGFDVIYSKEKFESDGYVSEDDVGWGVPDSSVFQVALKNLEQEKGPFLAEILTLSNHQPFNWDYRNFDFPDNVKYEGADVYKNYRKGIHYSDSALGQFWDAFMASSLKDNTIVVVTGDHGVPYYPADMQGVSEQFNVLFGVPLVFFDSDLSVGNMPDQVSHLDIAPTLLSLLDIAVPDYFFGRAILGAQKSQNERPIIHMNIDSYGLRAGGTLCLPNVNVCSAGAKNCINDATLSCELEKEADLNVVHQSAAFMKYLTVMAKAGYPLVGNEFSGI